MHSGRLHRTLRLAAASGATRDEAAIAIALAHQHGLALTARRARNRVAIAWWIGRLRIAEWDATTGVLRIRGYATHAATLRDATREVIARR